MAGLHRHRPRDWRLHRRGDGRRPALLPRRRHSRLAVGPDGARAGCGAGVARPARAHRRPRRAVPGRLVSDAAAPGAVRRDRRAHAQRRLPERFAHPAARDRGLRLADLVSLDSRVAQRRVVVGAARLLSRVLPDSVHRAVCALDGGPARRVPPHDFCRHGDVLSLLRGVPLLPRGGTALRLRRRAQCGHGSRTGTLRRLAARSRGLVGRRVPVVTTGMSLRYWRALGLVLLPFTAGLILAVVYGQFHYAVDALAGLIVAALMLGVMQTAEATAQQRVPVADYGVESGSSV